jgi:hypothetical protein
MISSEFGHKEEDPDGFGQEHHHLGVAELPFIMPKKGSHGPQFYDPGMFFHYHSQEPGQFSAERSAKSIHAGCCLLAYILGHHSPFTYFTTYLISFLRPTACVWCGLDRKPVPEHSISPTAHNSDEMEHASSLRCPNRRVPIITSNFVPTTVSYTRMHMYAPSCKTLP